MLIRLCGSVSCCVVQRLRFEWSEQAGPALSVRGTRGGMYGGPSLPAFTPHTSSEASTSSPRAHTTTASSAHS